MTSSPSLGSSPVARVIAFATTWSTDTLGAARDRLRALDAELIVLAASGDCGDDIAADLATASTLVAGATDSVFVLDGARAVRVGQGAVTLDDAIAAAAELLVTRRLASSTTPAPFAFLHRWSEATP